MLTALLLSGCIIGINPKAIPTQELYADDGEVRAFTGAVSFAVVGDTRDASPGDRALGREPVPGAEAAVAADVSRAIEKEGLSFVALTGNMVAGSSTASWKQFNHDWLPVLASSELSETGAARVRSIPVLGVDDRDGDERLKGYSAAFPGVGADIGYGRVASWYRFDLVTKGKIWRVITLDSDKAELGSRWNEQLAWIPKALEDHKYTGVIVLMNQPLVTLALKHTSNEGGGPKELLAAVDDVVPMGAVKAVFAGESGANEIFLPTGRFGELYVNACSGAPVSSLARWGKAPEAGFDDLKLETLYDLALLKAFDNWAALKGFPETVVDRAKARGSYAGFVGEFDAHAFPVTGWYDVTLAGEQMTVTFRAVGPDGTLADLYSIHLDGKDGWKIGS